MQETFEASFPADAAKGFAHSASLDPTATERAAGLRVEKEEGVACQLWWLPVMLGVHDTGNRVVKKVAKVFPDRGHTFFPEPLSGKSQFLRSVPACLI